VIQRPQTSDSSWTSTRGGRIVTSQLVDLVNITKEDEVLDASSGIGGTTTRYRSPTLLKKPRTSPALSPTDASGLSKPSHAQSIAVRDGSIERIFG
jgi:hypothetical protein